MARGNALSAEEPLISSSTESEHQANTESLAWLISKSPKVTLISLRMNPSNYDRLRAGLHKARAPKEFTENLMRSLTDTTNNPELEMEKHSCLEKKGVPLMDVIISQEIIFCSIYSKVLAKYLLNSLGL